MKKSFHQHIKSNIVSFEHYIAPKYSRNIFCSCKNKTEVQNRQYHKSDFFVIFLYLNVGELNIYIIILLSAVI